jgi:hypothetical protein
VVELDSAFPVSIFPVKKELISWIWNIDHSDARLRSSVLRSFTLRRGKLASATISNSSLSSIPIRPNSTDSRKAELTKDFLVFKVMLIFRRFFRDI